MSRVCLLLALIAVPRIVFGVMPEHPLPLFVEGEVLVKYRTASTEETVHAKQALGLIARRQLMNGRAELLELPAYMTVQNALDLLHADPAVEYAEPNFKRFARTVMPDDPLFADQWGLVNTGQPNFALGGPAGVPGADLNLAEAWDANGDGTADRVGDSSVVVAVIDDAVDTSHPDLSANIVMGRNFVPGQNPSNPNPLNSEEVHGTFVAGCIAAKGNDDFGVAGTAWNVSLMPLKFNFDLDSHLAALDFALNNGARIINASFGGPGFSQLERDTIAALANSDILYVAAAGNDDSNTDVAPLNYPANYDADNIVSVAATNRQDNIASFSQYGPLTVDVAAPGLQVVTTAPGGGHTTSPGISGTSFSSPYTAGVAALIKSHVSPTPDFREIKARLIESGSAVSGANPKQRTIGGRVDADRALEMSAGPSLVIGSIAVTGGDGNGQLDSGETLDLGLTVKNIWQNATGITASLSAAGPVTINTAQVVLNDLISQATGIATFSVSVGLGITDHRYVTFTLDLAADGGYSATRSFILEIGRLEAGVMITQSFAPRDVDLYDEFHAWHFDLTSLPPGHNQLIIETTSTATGLSSPDIDLLVKRNIPPQYNITVGTNPETPGFFCTSGTEPNCQDPEVFLSAGDNGAERVVIPNPQPGTYHIVIVNFEQLDGGLTYTLRASTSQQLPTPSGGGGGGLMPWHALMLLFAASFLRLLQLRIRH